MSLEIVQPDTLVEVGKFYNVRCAIMNNDYGASYYMPVIGEAHKDTQFDFPDKHLHIDGRFCGKSQYDRIKIDKNGYTNYVCAFKPSKADYTISSVVVKRLKCRRLTTGVKPPKEQKFGLYGNALKNAFFNWCRSMVGKNCAGKKCPHLGTSMVERDGQLVCPLHDLRGSLETNKIILHSQCLK